MSSMYNNEMPSLFNFTYTPCRRGAKTYVWLTNVMLLWNPDVRLDAVVSTHLEERHHYNTALVCT